MGNMIFIEDRRVSVKPLQNRLEAIQKLKPLITMQGCRSFMGMVNVFEFILPGITEIIKTNI